MLNSIKSWIAGIAASSIIAAFISGFFKGKRSEENKNLRAEKKANAKAKETQDRVVIDVDFLERVRRHFDKP